MTFLSKKLKKKIETLCGLVGLDWEARQKRAEQILCNNNWKQQLCNDLQGLSFRDLELHLQGVVAKRQKKEDSVERKLTHKDNHEKTHNRTLAEILLQVYRPRAEHGDSPCGERDKLKLLGKKTSLNVLSDPFDDDYQSEG